MGFAAIIFLLAIACLGLAGFLARNGIIRIILWVLAIPLAFLGTRVIAQGGIAEPFTPKTMMLFAAIIFWPLIGCMAGQVILYLKSVRERRDKIILIIAIATLVATVLTGLLIEPLMNAMILQ